MKQQKNRIPVIALALSLLIMIQPSACLALEAAAESKEAASEAGFDGYLISIDEDADRSEIRALEDEILTADDPEAEEICEDRLYLVQDPEKIKDILPSDAVECVEPNYILHIDDAGSDGVITLPTNDPFYSTNEWAYEMIGVEDVWEKGMTGEESITVAVVDTGLAGASKAECRHEDLDYGKIRDGMYFSSNGAFSSCDDENGHGTFVTGEVAAVMNNEMGISGLMPEVNILPVRIGGKDGSGTTADTVRALYSIIERGDVDVVNMSFGGTGTQAMKDACDAAKEAGMILIASAGTNGSGAYDYPASYDSVISVGSVDSDGICSSFSQHNDKVMVTAPGEMVCGPGGYSIVDDEPVYNPYATGGYCLRSGTSMAAPMVSSLAAMAKSLDPSIDADEFADLLQQTAKDLGEEGYDNYYGFGMIDFSAMYEAVLARPAECDHDYSDAVYTWEKTETGYTCTGSTTCSVCGDEISETVSANAEVIKAATNAEDGIKRYTAVFEDEHFSTQIKDVTIEKTGGQSGGGGTGGGSSGGGGNSGGSAPESETPDTDEDRASIDAVIAQINDLPESVTLENEASVSEARASYDALTEAQKAKVPADTYEKLTKAETTITQWKEYTAEVEAAKQITSKETSLKNRKGRKAVVKWKASKGIDGYQVIYSTNKKFSGKVKTKNVKAAAKKTTLKKLKKGKTYYVKVRTYKDVLNKATGETIRIYGKDSNVKKVKIKK